VLIITRPLARGSQIETGECFTRSGHPGDKADGFQSLALCHIDCSEDTISSSGKVLCTSLGTRDLFNLVAAIEGLGRLNDSRCWTVATGKPLLRIDRDCSPNSADVFDRWRELVSIDAQWLGKVIVVPCS
jgi:hypothetical protein